MNSTQNTPIQAQDHTQAWTRFIHSRLALQTKPQDTEIHTMQLNIDAIQTTTNIPDCMKITK